MVKFVGGLQAVSLGMREGRAKERAARVSMIREMACMVAVGK